MFHMPSGLNIMPHNQKAYAVMCVLFRRRLAAIFPNQCNALSYNLAGVAEENAKDSLMEGSGSTPRGSKAKHLLGLNLRRPMDAYVISCL